MKYRIDLIPNYGNDDIILEAVKKNPDIITNGKIYDSGFIGCDTPVCLDIECSPETKELLEAELRLINTDTFGIYKEDMNLDTGVTYHKIKTCEEVIKRLKIVKDKIIDDPDSTNQMIEGCELSIEAVKDYKEYLLCE
jgi:hypothetical protein